MRSVILSALGYFAIVFAAGFASGTVRTLMIAPVTSETLAVMLELPVMIAISWIACGWALKQWPVTPRLFPRVTMGAIAFVTLLLGELGVSMLLAGPSVAQHIATYREMPAQLGLLGQIPFAVFPLVRIWSKR